MTYSIIARCPRSGRLGIGITTYSLAVGGRNDGILADAGICKTQVFINRANDPIAVGLPAQGYAPGYVMKVLGGERCGFRVSTDRHPGSRRQWRGA